MTERKPRVYSAETRAKLSAAGKKGGATRKGSKHSEATKKKIGDAQRGVPKGTPSDETKQKISEALTGYTHTPEARANMAAGQIGRKKSPEERERNSEIHRGKVYSAETREKIGTASRSRNVNEKWNFTGRTHSPETREKMSAAHNARIASYSEPEFQAVVQNYLSALKAAGHYFRVGADLRERDGDLCQLCLEPIDFTVKTRTRWARSVDHVVPTAMGGPDEPWNLWLAHYGCNSRKNARFIGRSDGSTDIRRFTDEDLEWL